MAIKQKFERQPGSATNLRDFKQQRSKTIWWGKSQTAFKVLVGLRVVCHCKEKAETTWMKDLSTVYLSTALTCMLLTDSPKERRPSVFKDFRWIKTTQSLLDYPNRRQKSIRKAFLTESMSRIALLWSNFHKEILMNTSNASKESSDTSLCLSLSLKPHWPYQSQTSQRGRESSPFSAIFGCSEVLLTMVLTTRNWYSLASNTKPQASYRLITTTHRYTSEIF